MSKQLTLFGTFVPTTNHILYRYPKGDYECFVECYCLRAKKDRAIFNLKNVHAKTRTAWKDVYKGNKEKLEEFLALQKNEDSFVR